MQGSEWFIYLLEANVCLIVLYVLYKQVLYRETYFQWNRLFFLGAALISIFIPLVEFPVIQAENVSFFTKNNLVFLHPAGEHSFLMIEKENPSTVNQQFIHFINKFLTFGNIFLLVYFTVFFGLLLNFIRNILLIGRLIKKSEKEKKGKHTIIKTKGEIPAFSFMNYIFINTSQQELLNQDEKRQLFLHEKAHAHQWHTIDILFFEILGIFFWFNPLIKRMKNDLREVHEYIADDEAVKNENPANYSRLLLKLLTTKQQMQLGSNFSKHQIKKRIMMLMKPESNYLRKLRFLIALPLLGIVTVIFGFTKDIVRTEKNQATENSLLFTAPLRDAPIVTPYFKNKKLSEIYPNRKWDNLKEAHYRISHPEITYRNKTCQAVYAVADGQVAKIDSSDNWGVIELQVTIEHAKKISSQYKGLQSLRIKTGQKVIQNQIIGKTGVPSLYPSFSFRITKNDSTVNPMKFIKIK